MFSPMHTCVFEKNLDLLYIMKRESTEIYKKNAAHHATDKQHIKTFQKTNFSCTYALKLIIHLVAENKSPSTHY